MFDQNRLFWHFWSHRKQAWILAFSFIGLYCYFGIVIGYLNDWSDWNSFFTFQKLSAIQKLKEQQKSGKQLELNQVIIYHFWVYIKHTYFSLINTFVEGYVQYIHQNINNDIFFSLKNSYLSTLDGQKVGHDLHWTSKKSGHNFYKYSTFKHFTNFIIIILHYSQHTDTDEQLRHLL